MPVQTSVQLFTVNAALEADLDGTLAAIAARGFTAVEPYDFVRRASPLAASLAAHGLAAPTGHAFLHLVQGGYEGARHELNVLKTADCIDEFRSGLHNVAMPLGGRRDQQNS